MSSDPLRISDQTMEPADRLQLRSRLRMLKSKAGATAVPWWLLHRLTGLEYNWWVECRLDPTHPLNASPAPFTLHKVAREEDVAALDPGIREQLEQHTRDTLSGLVASNEALYFLTDGQRVVSGNTVALGPEVDHAWSPTRLKLRLPDDACYMWYGWTDEAYRGQRAVYRVFAAMLDDLARSGKRRAYGVVSRTNVAQIKNLLRLGWRPVAGMCTTGKGKLLFLGRYARDTLRAQVRPL